MTIDEKIAVLEAAKAKLVDYIVDCAAEMNNRVTNWAGVNGQAIPQLMATRGAIEDLLFDLREGFEQARIDEEYDSALAEQMGVRQ